VKCKFHPNADAIAECSNCGTHTCGFCTNYTKRSTLCEACLELSAASEFVAAQTRKSDSFEQMLTERRAQSESLDSEFSQQQSIRGKKEKVQLGVIFAEELVRDQVESCVLVFWEIAEILQNGQVPDETLKCAETDLPNIVTRSADDIIVSHPQPQLLGYSEIFVSKNSPIPELVN